MPMQDGEEGTMVAVLGIPKHPAHEANIRESRKPVRGAVSLVEDILSFDIDAELGGVADPFGDRGIEAVEAIQEQDLVFLQPYGFGASAPAFLKAVNRFFDGLPGEQRLEVAVQQLNVERLGILVVAIVDPVCGM